MATIYRIEDLEVWQIAFRIYKQISKLAQKLKLAKEYHLADQMKRASGSVMDNIAEGFEKRSRLEFINSLSIAKGECGELQSQLCRCFYDQYMTQIEYTGLYNETRLLLSKIASFIIYLNKSAIKGVKFKDRSKS